MLKKKKSFLKKRIINYRGFVKKVFHFINRNCHAVEEQVIKSDKLKILVNIFVWSGKYAKDMHVFYKNKVYTSMRLRLAEKLRIC